jgi:hypothetical protein
MPLALASFSRSPAIPTRLFAAVAITCAAGILPFYFADKADVTYSLLTYRGGLPIGPGSIWSLASDGALAPLIRHWDFAAVVAAAVVTNLWLATRRGGLSEARVFAAMSLTSAGFALLAKTVWPYYFFEVFVLATIWVAGTWRREDGVARLVMAPAAISTLAIVADITSPYGGLAPAPVRVEGVAMFFVLGLLMVWMVWEAGGMASAPRASSAAD